LYLRANKIINFYNTFPLSPTLLSHTYKLNVTVLLELLDLTALLEYLLYISKAVSVKITEPLLDPALVRAP